MVYNTCYFGFWNNLRLGKGMEFRDKRLVDGALAVLGSVDIRSCYYISNCWIR